MEAACVWVPAAKQDSIPLREGRKLSCGGREIALFNLGEKYFAVDAHCPHKAGPLADGIVAGDTVYCPLHNWRIDLASGCAMSGGEGGVRTYPVKLSEGTVFVGLPEGPAL